MLRKPLAQYSFVSWTKSRLENHKMVVWGGGGENTDCRATFDIKRLAPTDVSSPVNHRSTEHGTTPYQQHTTTSGTALFRPGLGRGDCLASSLRHPAFD